MPSGVKQPAEERFWAKVNKETDTDCWEWTGSLYFNGYGRFSVNRKNVKAHRFSYQLHYGAIPQGKVVMHSCDNRKCCNPKHLSIGTQAENLLDMINKNRDNKAKGSASGASKLTEEQVKEIREKLNLGMRQTDIAKEYNVYQGNISRIKNGKIWSHLNI